MTRDQAIKVRVRQLHGQPVSEADAALAIRILQENPEPITGREYARRRAALGMRKRGEPKVQVDLTSRQPLECPCGEDACEAEPARVVQELKPWALLKEDDAPAADPATFWQPLGGGNRS